MNNKTPVTVLTGFLGSGKTTLLNRILTENHGLRIAVIENEFGEIGIDQELVINADEEIFEMNNGCICCTVRGDLIRILGNLARRKDKFDRIVLETTGMADPGPVAQTFFVDDEIAEDFYLDGIVTLVDAGHIMQHLHESDEAMTQIAFADLIVLNKTDLVDEQQLLTLEQKIGHVNKMTRLMRARMADVPIDQVLDLGGFDLDRALEKNPAFLEPEYPFEWAGLYDLTPGKYILNLKPGPDSSMSLVIDRVRTEAKADLARMAEEHFRYFSVDPIRVNDGVTISPGDSHWLLQLDDRPEYRFIIDINNSGHHVLFTQHTPEEFSANLINGSGDRLKPLTTHYFNPGHSHDPSVSSVAFEFAGALDAYKANCWISLLLKTSGADIFRMKGILNFAGNDQRVTFQAVHMLFDAKPGRNWNPDEERINRLVFIGRNLNRDYLEGALKSCLVMRDNHATDKTAATG
jgi:G3E family GTPase